jgi:hypothetical protein
MIKEYLELLLERDYHEPSMTKTVKMLLETYDDNQLGYMLHNGLKISNDINLYYFEGQGFRCNNDNSHIIGNKPVCQVIQKTLNNKLLN